MAAERTAFLAEHLGGIRQLAALLEVSPSQPSRWARSLERPSLEAARRLLDLDHVLARTMLVWEAPVAAEWLVTPSAFLDGARPVDVVAHEGAAPVLRALEAMTQGAFA